jgi:hypothetical protein
MGAAVCCCCPFVVLCVREQAAGGRRTGQGGRERGGRDPSPAPPSPPQTHVSCGAWARPRRMAGLRGIPVACSDVRHGCKGGGAGGEGPREQLGGTFAVRRAQRVAHAATVLRAPRSLHAPFSSSSHPILPARQAPGWLPRLRACVDRPCGVTACMWEKASTLRERWPAPQCDAHSLSLFFRALRAGPRPKRCLWCGWRRTWTCLARTCVRQRGWGRA